MEFSGAPFGSIVEQPVNTIHVRQDLACGNAKRLDPASEEPRVPAGIPFGPIVDAMELAVDFDRQLQFVAVEVENVAPLGMLASEFPAVEL